MRTVSLLLLSLMAVTGSRVHPAPEDGLTTAEPLSWLAGCWRLSRGSTVIDEQWLSPLGGMMLGSSRTVKNGAVQEYEFMVLRTTATGATYEAHPSGQDSTTFTANTAPTGEMVVFENPAHDFPQKVGYRRVSVDSVVAWIEGKMGASSRKIEFPYRRVGCTAP